MTDNNTLADYNIKDFDAPSNNNKRTLKLTECRKRWVHNQLRKYAEQIGITEQEIPNVVFSRKEVLALPRELTAGRRTVTHRYFGLCFRKAQTILINVKKHTSFKDLRHTIVHELVHYRFQYLKHGARFENRISLILKGKRYGCKLLYIQNEPSPLSPHSQDHEDRLHIRTNHCIVNPKITATDERGS
jgi:hypothetical protein